MLYARKYFDVWRKKNYLKNLDDCVSRYKTEGFTPAKRATLFIGVAPSTRRAKELATLFAELFLFDIVHSSWIKTIEGITAQTWQYKAGCEQDLLCWT